MSGTGWPPARDPFAHLHGQESFAAAAERALGDSTLRANLGRATATVARMSVTGR